MIPAGLAVKGSTGRLNQVSPVAEPGADASFMTANRRLIGPATEHTAQIDVTESHFGQQQHPSPLFMSEEVAKRSLKEQCAEYFREEGSQDSSMLDFLRVICLCHDVTKVTD